MADHGQVEYATAQGNDIPAHVAMYDRFVHLVVVGGAHVANIVLGLAIGGVAGHWLLAFAIFLTVSGVAATRPSAGSISRATAMRIHRLLVTGDTAALQPPEASASAISETTTMTRLGSLAPLKKPWAATMVAITKMANASSQ